MLAWQVEDHGGAADALRLNEAPEPTPEAGQVRIAVEAVPLNFADDLLCRGRYQVKPEPPFTPGVEVVGRIDAVAPGSALREGTRVLASAWMPHGGLAQRAIAREVDVHPIGDRIDATLAAGLGIPYQTAYLGLRRRCGLAVDGEATVLVHAAAGATGSAALQLAKAYGARVIATAGGGAKTALCLELGADLAIDYRSDDFVERVLAATDGRGADIVFDTVGGDTLDRSLKCTAWEGSVAVVGFASGDIPALAANRIMLRNISIVGVYVGEYTRREPALVATMMHELGALCESGRLNPCIHEVAPFDEAPRALADLAARKTTGRVIVRGPAN